MSNFPPWRGTYTLHTELKEIPKSTNSAFWFSLLIVFWENEEWCSLRNRHNFIDWRFWGHTTTFIDVVLFQFKLAIILFCKKPRGKNTLLLESGQKNYLFLEEKTKKELSLGMGLLFFVLLVLMDGLCCSSLQLSTGFEFPAPIGTPTCMSPTPPRVNWGFSDGSCW